MTDIPLSTHLREKVERKNDMHEHGLELEAGAGGVVGHRKDRDIGMEKECPGGCCGLGKSEELAHAQGGFLSCSFSSSVVPTRTPPSASMTLPSSASPAP